ncbi:hypothetical protein EJB05_06931, partial [Eragrostis curvula]
MSTTPRGRSFNRRGRCKCAGGNGDRAACCFNPLKSLFRCPGRGRSKHRQRTPSRVRDAPAPDGGVAQQQQQQGQEEEPSFFVYAMPNQGGGFGNGGGMDGAGSKKKKKHRKRCMPSFGSCFRRKNKKDRKARAAAAATVATDRRPALTPASSMLTHPPGSPVPADKSQPVTPSSMTQPPSPAPTENTSVVNSPAPPGRQSATNRGLPATPRPGKQSTDSARSSPFAPPPPQMQQPAESVRSRFAPQQMQQSAADSPRSPFAPPQMQQPTDSAALSPFEQQMQQSAADSAWSPFAQNPKQVDGLEIVEVATGERLSTHDLGLIEMVAGSSTDNSSAESSVKSSLEYVNESPPPPVKQTVVEREVVVVKAREQPKLWLNGKTMESRARERFTEPLKVAEAEELWAHDIACSRVHASMLAETIAKKDCSYRLYPKQSVLSAIT